MPRHPHVAPSSSGLSDQVFSALVARARALGKPVHPLHVGDTYRDPLPMAQAEAIRSADHPRLHNYAPVQGEPVLLDAVRARLRHKGGVEVVAENVQIMSGATAGLSVVCQTLLAPGDEVIVPSPYWPLIRGIVSSRGGVVREVPLFCRLDEAGLDVEAELERAVGPRTVAVYVNSPNNPTGRVLSAPILEAIGRVATRHDLWILCDEAYEELDYTGRPPTPLWARPGLFDRSVSTHTLSKGYGYAGARVGFTHGPAHAMGPIRAVQTFQVYCAPKPFQIGAARALREGDPWLAEARAAYREAGARAAATLGIAPPEGGTFLFFDASPHLEAGETTALPFLERCLDAGVLLTPGSACGAGYERHVRLCFTSVAPDELDAALACLARVLRH